MILDLTTWWQALSAGEQLFWGIGLTSNILFVVYVALQLIGGHDAEHPDGLDADFTILSVRSLLAFGMFMGWTGLLVTRAGGSMPLALLSGAAAGILAAWLAWRLFKSLLRLQSSGNLEPYNAIGQTGTVHLRIPANQGGTGKIMINVQGALRELEAVSEAEAIPTGASIIVVGMNEQDVLIVQSFETEP